MAGPAGEQHRLGADHVPARDEGRRPARHVGLRRPARRIRSRARDQPAVPLAATAGRRADGHRLRDVGAPERGRRVLRARHRRPASSPGSSRACASASATTAGPGTWNAAIEPRDRDRRASDDQRGDAAHRARTTDDTPDLIFGPPYDTRIVVRDLGPDLRYRGSGANRASSWSAGCRGLRRRPDEPLVPLTRRERGEPARRSAVRRRLRGPAHRGRRVQLQAEGALDVRLEPRQGAHAQGAPVKVHSILFHVPIRADQDHFDIRAEVRPHWSATVGPVTLVMDGAGAWVGWWADDPGGAKECIGSAAADRRRAPARPSGRERRRLPRLHRRAERPLRRRGHAAVGPPRASSRFTVTAFGIHELTGTPTDDRPRPHAS